MMMNFRYQITKLWLEVPKLIKRDRSNLTFKNALTELYNTNIYIYIYIYQP